MFQLILKLLLAGVVAVGAFVLLAHVFPVVVAVLAIIGVVKLYEIFSVHGDLRRGHRDRSQDA
jgi:hypothetical protein